MATTPTPIPEVGTPPDYPVRAGTTDKAAFLAQVATADARFPVYNDELNAATSAINAAAVVTYDNALRASESAATAKDSAQVAQSASNFVGEWVAQSGSASIPLSVYHDGRFWVLLQDVENISANEPSDLSTVWADIQTVGALSDIRTPKLIEPLSGATNVILIPTLEAGGYASIYGIARDYREFQVDLGTGDFSAPLWSVQVDADSAVVDVPLASNTGHKWRCRDVATDGSTSDWSSVAVFSTGTVVIDQPTLTVEGSPSDVPETPTLETSAFAVIGGSDTHLNTDWQVLDDQLQVVWESMADAADKLSIVVPAGVLSVSTSYTFRARHRGEAYGEGAWVSVVATTTDDFSYGKYLAVAHRLIPGITIYGQDVDTFDKLADPDVLSLGTGYGVAFSADGTYLAVAHRGGTYITIYKRSGDTFTKLADPNVLPTDRSRSVAFSADGTYLAVAHQDSPFITIYKRSGDTFTKLADPNVLPTATGWGVAFSADGTYLAVVCSSSPFITIYKRSGDTFTKLADPATLPTGEAYAVAFYPRAFEGEL